MGKDWIGNSRSGMYGLGASNRSKRDREELDFYATPPIATEALLKKLDEVGIKLPTKIPYVSGISKNKLQIYPIDLTCTATYAIENKTLAIPLITCPGSPYKLPIISPIDILSENF